MRVGVLAALCLALSAGVASAHTTIISPNPAYQQWVDRARVPTPDLSLAVSSNISGCVAEYGMAQGCAEVAKGTIALAASEGKTAFFHELGHFFDPEVLSDWDRSRFSWLIGIPMPWAYPFAVQHDGPSEYFAESYALCATQGRRIPFPEMLRPDDSPISVRRHFQICTLIQRSYWR